MRCDRSQPLLQTSQAGSYGESGRNWLEWKKPDTQDTTFQKDNHFQRDISILLLQWCNEWLSLFYGRFFVMCIWILKYCPQRLPFFCNSNSTFLTILHRCCVEVLFFNALWFEGIAQIWKLSYEGCCELHFMMKLNNPHEINIHHTRFIDFKPKQILKYWL